MTQRQANPCRAASTAHYYVTPHFYFNLLNVKFRTNNSYNKLNNNCKNKYKINFQKNKLSLTFGFINIRSINNKSLIIYDLLSSNKYSILGLAETWHESSHSPSLLTAIPPGYTFLDVSRSPSNPLSHKHSSYGGLCLIFKNIFSASFDSTFKSSSFECLFTKMSYNSYHFIVILIYRSPSGSVCNFINDFYNLIEYVFSLSIQFFIMGDFNLHYNKPEDFYVSKFIDILNTFNLIQHISTPTHTSGNTIDFLITSSVFKINNLETVKFHYSDHYIINFLYLIDYNFKNTTIKLKKRNWKLLDRELFGYLLKHFDFVGFNDVDVLLSYFYNVITIILDIILPLKLFSFRLLSKRAPWFDIECISLKRIARKYERTYRSNKSKLNYDNYRSALHTYKSSLFSKHCNYLRNSIIKAASSKNRWVSLSKLLHKDLPPPTSFSSQDYHTYIVNKVELLRSNFSNTTTNLTSTINDNTNKLNKNINNDNFNFVEFSLVTLSELTSIINSMSSSSCPLDIIPTNLIKEMSDIFYPIINLIINLSLSSSKFPSSFKSSIIIPTLKNNSLDPSLLSSYRPIANLSFISKVLEKVVYKQMYHYLHTYSLFPSSQSGFRVAHSCETSLLKLYNDLILAFDHNKFSILVGLDYSSAFDTVDHSLLILVLKNYFNIHGSSLSWIESYLSNRLVYVSLNHSTSIPSTSTYGVPQGSILGPLFFILYVSELSNIISSHNLNSLSYADDSHIYVSFDQSSLNTVMSSISSCLTSIDNWSTSMFLKLNPSKFELIYFDRVGNLIKNSCNFSSNSIEPSDHIRSLGFIFDSKLTLSNQILSVTKCCYFHLRRIRQLLPYLDDPSLHLLVSALILSRIDYCNSLYYGIPESTLKPLNKVFNYAARLVTRSPPFTHITPSLILLHWLPIKYRIIFKISLMMFKLKNNFLPEYLKTLIVQPFRPNLRSSSQNHYFIPSINHTFAKRSFSYAGPHVWNSLPSTLLSCNSLLTFRSGLKTFLFNKFIEECF